MSVILKRKNNSGDINAYDDAILTFSSIGDGYLARAYDGLECSLSNNKIIIKSGIILFGGRIVEIPKGSTIEIDISSIEAKNPVYVILTVTIADDDTQSDATITATVSKSKGRETNPIDGVGTHKMVLFTFSANSREKTVNVKSIEPGVAKNALNLLPSGKIGGKKFWDLFLDDMSGVRYAKNADVAAEAEGFVGGDINKVSANLYMPNRGVYLLQEAVLINRSESLTIKKNEKVRFTDPSFPILSGRNKLALLVSTERSDTLTPDKIPSNIVEGAPNKFDYQGLSFSIYEEKKLGSSNVEVFNATDHDITVPGLHLKLYQYGG